MPQKDQGPKVPNTRRYRRRVAQAEAKQKEAKIRKSLKKRPKKNRSLPGAFGPFGRVLAKKASKLFEEPWFGYLKQLENLSSRWVRPMEKWKPKGKSPRTQFRSLTRHLLVKYSVPHFLLDAFMEEHEGTREIAIKLLVHIGQGGSLYKAVKPIKGGLAYAPPLFPVPLTKKMCRQFLAMTSEHTLATAVRHAQVRVYGGSHRLVQALCKDTHLGRQIHGNEKFWDHVIQWLCQQHMLNPHEVGPIIDWVSYQRANNTSFSMKGRTGTSVLRAVEEWHGDLSKLKNHRMEVFDSSGVSPGRFERKINLPGGGFHMEEWSIVELLTSRELHAEGSKMRHCVFSYSRDIRSGRCSIWSLRVDDARQLTIEVMNHLRRVVQIRGRFNRLPKDIEMRYIRLWAQENGLEVRASRW